MSFSELFLGWEQQVPITQDLFSPTCIFVGIVGISLCGYILINSSMHGTWIIFSANQKDTLHVYY